MTTCFDRETLGRELPGWALRGVLCAASSAAWAVLMGFSAPAEILGMVLGVAGWVLAFAAFSAWTPPAAWWSHAQAVAALKGAVWLKVGLAAAGWLGFGLGGALHLEDLAQLGLLGMLDTLLGLAALALVSFTAGLKGPEFVAAADSFGLTALTTLTEGALMALVLAGLALALWVGWRLAARLGLNWKFLPAPRAG